MKHRFVFMAFTLSLLCAVGAAAQGATVIKSYRNGVPFGFTYGSWAGQTEAGGEGVAIGGTANRRGGAGESLPRALDLSRATSLVVVVEALPGNGIDTFNVLLRTRQGPGGQDFLSSRYTFYVGNLRPGQPATLRLPLGEGKAVDAAKGAADLARIDQIQVQGNYANDTDAVRLRIAEICAE